jgi:hypothetical protein
MKANKYTDFQLEQFLLEELPAEVMKNIRTQVETDSVLKDRIDELKNSGIEILKKYPADMMSVKIINGIKKEKENSAEILPVKEKMISAGSSQISLPKKLIDYLSGKSGRTAYSITAALAASAAAIVLILNFPVFNGHIPVVKDNDVIRIKGMEPGISIHRKTGRSIEELKDMAEASEGDLLQIGYISTGEYNHGTVLSIDGRGSVTLHYPESESGDTLIKVNRKVMLKRSYELDDSPYYEKFILIISKKPLDVKSIIERAKILAKSRENVLNGQVTADGDSLEFSLTVKK